MFLRNLGRQQATAFRYSGRFLSSISRWMSPELKKEVLMAIVSAGQEDTNLIGGLLNLLDDGIDRETKLNVLKLLRKKMTKQIDTIDKMIADLEEKKT